MPWIDDVRNDIRALDTSPKKLRGFGLIVGAVFILLGSWFFWKGVSPWRFVFGFIGTSLVTAGLIAPRALRTIYKGWMGFAFGVGWIVSRIILALLYYVVVTPVGLAARLLGKKFMDIDMRKKKDSYWIMRERNQQDKYEKMY